MDITLMASGRKRGNQQVQMESEPKVAAIGTIGRLTDYVLDSSDAKDIRDIVIRALDRYAERHKGTRKGIVASKAAATIVAANMLETFCEDGDACAGGARL